MMVEDASAPHTPTNGGAGEGDGSEHPLAVDVLSSHPNTGCLTLGESIDLSEPHFSLSVKWGEY